jgi:hypothetical protein
MKQYAKYRIFGGFLSTLVAVFAFGSSQVYAAPDVVKLYVAPASQSVVSGNSVTVQVRLSKAANAKVDYAKADMTFSTNQLEVISVSRSGSYFNATGGPVTSFNNSKGTINISGSGDTLPTNADVLVASVTFKAKAAGTGTLSFTGASVAGDLLGSGNVKNSLTATAGTSVVVSSPPTTPPATTQPKPSSTSQSQPPSTQTPAPVAPDSDPENTVATRQDEQTDFSPSTGQTEAANDIKAPGTRPIQIWQWVLSGLISLAAIGGIAYVLITKKREQSGMLPDSTPEPVSLDTQTETIVDENAAAELLAIGSAASADAQDKHEAEPLAQPTPVYVQPEHIVPVEPVSVEGVEIEPLDPAWPTRLNSAPPAEFTAVANVAQNVPVAPVVQPQPQVIEPVYAPQPPAAVAIQEPIQALQPVQVVPPVAEASIPVQQVPPTAPQQTDDFPDMFEEGAARLTAEGLDEQLKPKNAV